MSKVRLIPFLSRFKEPMLNGQKTWTSRSRIYGLSGDVFEAFGAKFQILHVQAHPLGVVLDHWRDEGCSSREDFLAVWGEIHRRRLFDPETVVYVHVFKRMEEEK